MPGTGRAMSVWVAVGSGDGGRLARRRRGLRRPAPRAGGAGRPRRRRAWPAGSAVVCRPAGSPWPTPSRARSGCGRWAVRGVAGRGGGPGAGPLRGLGLAAGFGAAGSRTRCRSGRRVDGVASATTATGGGQQRAWTGDAARSPEARAGAGGERRRRAWRPPSSGRSLRRLPSSWRAAFAASRPSSGAGFATFVAAALASPPWRRGRLRCGSLGRGCRRCAAGLSSPSVLPPPVEHPRTCWAAPTSPPTAAGHGVERRDDRGHGAGEVLEGRAGRERRREAEAPRASRSCPCPGRRRGRTSGRG